MKPPGGVGSASTAEPNAAVPGSLTHTLVRSLIEFHVLGALPADLGQDVDEHLAHCPDCRAKALPARQVAHLLLLAAPDAEPPPSLRTRVLRAALVDGPTHRAGLSARAH